MAEYESTVLVVGAGISGLATAWHLAATLDANGSVLIVDSSDRPGGTAWTDRQQGYNVEAGPNGFLDNKPSTLRLCGELGLGEKLVRANSDSANRFVFLGDRLRKLPASPGEFLRSDLLSWPGKLRVLTERFRQRGNAHDESIYQFGCRRIGKEATEKLLDAFVTGILAGDPQLLSLPACFPRMVELEKQYGSLIGAQIQLAKQRRAQSEKQQAVGAPGGTLTVPEGGMRSLVERLADLMGPRLHLQQPIQSIHATEDGHWHVTGATASYRTRSLVLACPAYTQAGILRETAPDLAGEIGAIAYTTAVVAAVGFKRSELPDTLNGFGYLSPQRLGRPVLGMLWSSSIFKNQAPEGYFQFRAILGGWRRRDVIDWTDEQVITAVQEDLQQTLGIKSSPSFTWIHRWEKAIPQYHLGHLDRLGRIDTALGEYPGLFLTGNSFRGVSLNDCTLDAERTAEQVSRYLAE